MNRWLLAAVLVGAYVLLRTARRPEDAAVTGALAAEAVRMNAPPESLTVRSVTPHTWPDAGLGLGSPFELAAQVLTPGFLVEVVSNAGRTVAEYHCDQLGRCLFCPPCSARLSRLNGAAA